MSSRYLKAAKGSLILSALHLSKQKNDRGISALNHAASSLIKGGKPALAEKIKVAVDLMNHQDMDSAIREIQDTVYRLEESMKKSTTQIYPQTITAEPSTITDVSCHQCDEPTPKHSKFCCQCGTKQVQPICDSCNVILDLGSNFCSQCGKDITFVR